MNPPPLIPATWPVIVRQALAHGHNEIRPHADLRCIEVRSAGTGKWHCLEIPGGGVMFASFKERDEMLGTIKNI